MIKSITKLRNLGLFNNYTPISNLKEFKKYNLIYGWNATGKTSLTKLFDTLETGAHPNFPNIEYEVKNSVGSNFQQGQALNQQVRVFNQDYIEQNLQIRDGKAKPITLILGNASKEALEQIESDEKDVEEKTRELQQQHTSLEQKETTRGKTFTDIARTIYVALTGGATRNYRKNNAEADFSSFAEKKLLEEDEIEKLILAVKQLPKPLIPEPAAIQFTRKESEEELSLQDAINTCTENAKELLNRRVDSIIIERLKSHIDIADWVEIGITIHEFHDSTNCEFCGQKMPAIRLEELGKHFSKADKELKDDIDTAVTQILKIQREIQSTIDSLPDSARLYEDLTADYDAAHIKSFEETKKIVENLQRLVEVVKSKKTKATDIVELSFIINANEFNESLVKTVELIKSHNEKTTRFDTARTEAETKLKEHYLSTIYDEIKTLDSEISEHKSQINILINGDSSNSGILGLTQLKQRIRENQGKISSTHKACDELNAALATFLGRNELTFEPHTIRTKGENGQEVEVDDGYILKRNQSNVHHLSEGEKTAIAFVYFTIHLNDSTFDKTKGIIVIDDPISSLDSNSMFQAFSFLKNAVKDAEQIFIFTHNFDFLKLLLNWLGYSGMKSQSNFYMVKNSDTPTGRVAYLDELDKDLQNHESEYNYLFKQLYNFQSDGTIASSYHMPNISRKVLETFLMFRVPNNSTTYLKLESLKDKFDGNKLTAIYKFTNDQSHITGKGFDPSLVPETQKTVKYLLEFIETTFPEHYLVLTSN